MAVFLFYGDDTYSLEKKLQFWKQEFEKKHGGDMNISIFPGDTLAGEIFQACCALPFLGEKRLVIVKNFFTEASDEARSGFADLIEQIPDFCVLVFAETAGIDRRLGLFKKLQKFGKLTEFFTVTGGKLLGWIQDEVAARGATIEKDAVITLAELLPADLYRLENEIAKLVSFANGRIINKKDIELLVDVELEASIFKLTDGIGQKNRRVSLQTLHQLIDTGEELHRILYMIMRQFRIILCVKDLLGHGLSRDAIASKIKEHPFVVSNTMMQSKNFSLDQLKRAYELLVDIDTRLKSGGIKVLVGDTREFVLALDRLVLELCR